MKQAFGKVWNGTATPEEVLRQVQNHLQAELEKSQHRWSRLAGILQKQWSSP